jgi:hypothetical protein
MRLDPYADHHQQAHDRVLARRYSCDQHQHSGPTLRLAAVVAPRVGENDSEVSTEKAGSHGGCRP